jgi:uncharacterized membrane protein YqgA involved in biofilm formation
MVVVGCAPMLGTIVNVSAILAGGVAGLATRRTPSPALERRIKMILGVLTIYVGLKTVWQSVNGPFLSVLGQVAIMLVSLVLGNAIGKGLRLQARLNKLGEHAKGLFARRSEHASESGSFSEGFVTCTILFCVGPMAIVGALEDGLTGKIQTLAIKSVMDGLATLAFVKTFGAGPIFAAIPVLAYQGTITLGAGLLQGVLNEPGMIASISATGGLLILCISVVILDIQRVPLADYLPSLAVAPALTWIFR